MDTLFCRIAYGKQLTIHDSKFHELQKLYKFIGRSMTVVKKTCEIIGVLIIVPQNYEFV